MSRYLRALRQAPGAASRWSASTDPFRPTPEATVKHVFLDSNARLRNGWWILAFIALLLASRFAYTPASRALQDLGVSLHALEPLRFGFLLLVTWICVRLRREPLSSIGFVLDARWARELGVGSLLGIASALLAVAMIWASGGVRLEADPARSLATLANGACVFLFVALFEETLFRGFVFQRLVAGTRAWIALIVLGLLFATSHWGNPDMHGATLAWATVELFLGAVLLGLAYLRTRSLALPIGIHFGWNWALGNILGFGVSGFEQAGWFRPLLLDRPDWMTGGAFGPEASIFAVVVDALLIVGLCRWKGPAGQRVAARTAGAGAGQVRPVDGGSARC
jgi:membrane protease YdiL (CAAX protease family)